MNITPESQPPSRWRVLPGDPLQLKRWLAAQQAAASPEQALPADWPQEPS